MNCMHDEEPRVINEGFVWENVEFLEDGHGVGREVRAQYDSNDFLLEFEEFLSI